MICCLSPWLGPYGNAPPCIEYKQKFLEFAGVYMRTGNLGKTTTKNKNAKKTASPQTTGISIGILLRTQRVNTIRHSQAHTERHAQDVTMRQTVVDSHTVSDKSPRRVLGFKWRLQSVSLIRGECGGRNVPTHPLPRPATPPFKRHFGCVPDVRDIIRQTAPSRRQLHKYDRDVRITFFLTCFCCRKSRQYSSIIAVNYCG